MTESPRADAVVRGFAIPRGSLVVPFWDYLYRILHMKHKKELLRSRWVRLPFADESVP